MKTLFSTATWLRLANRLLSGLLLLLGFGSCNDEKNMLTAYGMPYSTFEVKGKVTQTTTGLPVEGAQVVVKMVEEGGHYVRPLDTVRTDGQGNYQWKGEHLFTHTVRVVCSDPSGSCLSDSTEVSVEPKGGKGWYQGSDSKQVDFTLKEP